jgi:hypothetical protein
VDLTKPVTYRGLDLTKMEFGGTSRPLRGISLSRAVYGEVQGEGYREKRALADGFDAGGVYLGFRPVELQGTIAGDTLEDFWDRLQQLRAILTPTLAYADEPGDLGFLPLKFHQPTKKAAWPDYLIPGTDPPVTAHVIPLEIRCRPLAQPRFVVDKDRFSGPTEFGFATEWSCQLWARDPRIYVQQREVDALTGSSGSGTLQNRGDYPSPVNFSLLVGATQTGARTFHFSGFDTSFDVTIPAGTEARLVRVDSYLRVVTLQTGTSEVLAMDRITFASGATWPEAPRGASSAYTWTCSGTGGLALGSEVWHNEAFA